MASPEIFDIPIGKVVGRKGDTGNGIASIELLSTSGLNKTYRITMTDETTFDFIVTDGNGITGATFDAQTNELTLTFDNGTSFTTPSLKGVKGDPAVIYTLEPTISAIPYDPNASFAGASITVNAYRTTGQGARESFTAQEFHLLVGTASQTIARQDLLNASSATLIVPSTATPDMHVTGYISAWVNNQRVTLATVEVPFIREGLDGTDGVSPAVTVTPISGGHTVEIEDADGVKTFDVMDGVIQSVNGKSAASITLDAGDIGYDSTETYQSGTAGAALNDLNRQLSDVVGVDEWYDADLWLEGHLNSATGAISTSTTFNRMSTPNLIPANVTCIKVQEGYKIIPYCWSADGSTYLGLWNGTAPQKTWDENAWMVGTVDLKAISTEYRFKILAQLVTGSRQLTPEADADKFIFTSFSDETLSISGKAADAKATGDQIANVESKVSDETTGLGTKAPVIINTASGDIASFDDGADSMLIRELVANIEPVQDLHGYDHPWIGGAGKNLLPMTVDGIKAENTASTWDGNSIVMSGVTITILTDDDGNVTGINCNGTASAVVVLWLGPIQLASGDAVKVVANTQTDGDVFFRISGPGKGQYVININSGTYTATSDVEVWGNIRIGSGSTVSNKVFYPVVCKSTETDTAFEPYSNMCSITGHSGMTGKRTGKNLLPYPSTVPQAGSTVTQSGVTMTHNEDGTLSFSGTASMETWFYFNSYTTDHSRDFQFVPGDYIISSGISGATTNGYRLQITIYEDGVIKRAATDIGSGANFTINEGETEAVYLYVPSGKNMDGITIKPMLRLASDTDATFEPYAEKDISVNWQDTAGTVYDGTLDVISGFLTVTAGYIESYNGETLPGKWISDRDVYAVGTLPTTGAQVVYDLAEPIPYQLTPQEVVTLFGTNNIWADVGPVSVEYPADTKLYIDNKITQAIANALNS